MERFPGCSNKKNCLATGFGAPDIGPLIGQEIQDVWTRFDPAPTPPEPANSAIGTVTEAAWELLCGGSGFAFQEPNTPDPAELVWQYNTMITEVPTGFIVIRLTPDRPSVGRLGTVTVDGQPHLVPTETTLFFRLFLPGMPGFIDCDEPLRLELDNDAPQAIEDWTFRQSQPAVFYGLQGVPFLTLATSSVSVTPAQHLQIVDVRRDSSFVSFTVAREVDEIDGTVAWFVHNADFKGTPIPVGKVEWDAGQDVSMIRVPLADYPELADNEIHIEAVGLADSRHLWADVRA